MSKKTPAPRGRPKDPRKTEKIIKSAGRLFMENGLQKTSMDAIAAEAGVSKQTLYTHFANKDDLFSHVIKAKVASYRLAAFDEHDFEQSPRKVLTQVGTALMHLVTDPEAVDMQRVVIAECRAYPRIANLFYAVGPDACFHEMADIIATLNRTKQIKCPDPKQGAIFFANLCKSEIHSQLLMGIKPPRLRVAIRTSVEEAVSIFMKIYGTRKRVSA